MLILNVTCHPACIVQGPTGAQGATGTPGREGAKGFPGRDGKPGADGQPGAQVHFCLPFCICLSVRCFFYLTSSYKHIAHTHTHTQGPTGLPGQKGERGLPGEPVSACYKLIN